MNANEPLVVQRCSLPRFDHLIRHGGPTIKHCITVYPSRLYNVAKFEAMGLRIGTDPLADCAANRASSRGKGRRQRDSRVRHLQRDARMTRASDYDILWVRSEDEARKLYGDKYRTRVSATEMNRLRRLEGCRNVCTGRQSGFGRQRRGRILNTTCLGVFCLVLWFNLPPLPASTHHWYRSGAC
jgi:hypothetical protein